MKLIYSTGGCGLSKEQKLTAARTKNRDQNAYRELCFSSFMRTETERPRRDAPGVPLALSANSTSGAILCC